MTGHISTDVYGLLVVEVNTDKQSDKVTMTKGGLTKKVLKTLIMLYSNNNTTPAATISLGTDAGGTPFYEPS